MVLGQNQEETGQEDSIQEEILENQGKAHIHVVLDQTQEVRQEGQKDLAMEGPVQEVRHVDQKLTQEVLDPIQEDQDQIMERLSQEDQAEDSLS